MRNFVAKTTYTTVGTMNTWLVNSIIVVCKNIGYKEK